MFEREFQFFIDHQQELVSKYRGKVLLLRDHEVAGVYETPLKALLDAQKKYKPGTYMIQPCEPGPEAYTITISSTAVFGNARA